MTFQTAKIQALIAEIDAVLSKDSKSRFGWWVGDSNVDRQMLERVRQQLEKWQEQSTIVQATGGEAQVAEIASYPIWVEQSDREGDRVLLSESLQTEVASLQQQREVLLKEIQQLQQQKQALIDPELLVVEKQQIVKEFSQELIDRLQETVNQQLAETLEKIQAVQLPNKEAEISLTQETETSKLEFISLEATPINPYLEFITSSTEPLPYAGVELTPAIIEKVENVEIVTLPLQENDTISALTDLIEDAIVTTVSSEEDLLTNELVQTKSKVDLCLGNNIAEQLNEDLSDLEEVEQLNVLPLEDIRETITEATDSIDLDLAAAVEQDQEKINTAIPEHILAEFEDLFGDSSNSSIATVNVELKPEETPESVTSKEPKKSGKKN